MKYLILILVALATACSSTPTEPAPTPLVVYVTPEPTATTRPDTGTPFATWSSHVEVTLSDLQTTLQSMVDYGNALDLVGAAAAAGVASEIAAAEVAWLGTIDPQDCYSEVHWAYKNAMGSIESAYGAAYTAMSTYDVAAMDSATTMIGFSNDNLAEATDALDRTAC